MNVVAFEVGALRMAPVIPDEQLQAGLPDTLGVLGEPRGTPAGQSVHEVGDEIEAAAPAVRETWSPQWKAQTSAFRHLTAFRQTPPGIRSFG